MLESLAGRVFVVTGGGSGIGLATARRLVAEGSRVAMLERDADAAAAVVAELGSQNVLACPGDVSDEGTVADVFNRTLELWGRIDGLHNNAGVERAGGPLVDVDVADLDLMYRVNMRGAFLCLREMLRSAVKRHTPAAIVNTSSGSVLRTTPYAGAYPMSKVAVVTMTRTAAVECAGDRIRVNAVVPGPIDTPMVARLPEHLRSAMRDSIPLGRFGQPEEIAAATAWLLSDESSFVTGALLSVDGASTA